MNSQRQTRWADLATTLVLTFGFVLSATTRADDDAKQQAQQILSTTGVQGGLVVHLGAGDGKLTAALRASDSYLVQGLASEAADVDVARREIKRQGLYGDVSVDQLRSRRQDDPHLRRHRGDRRSDRLGQPDLRAGQHGRKAIDGIRPRAQRRRSTARDPYVPLE